MAVESTFMTLIARTALFAQEAGGGEEAAPASSLIQMLLPFVAIFALFYFILIRPQRREQARRQTMLSEVKKNDRVLTAGGVYGVVTNINRDADEVTVKVDESTNTKLRLTLSSITRVLGDGPSDQSDNK